MYKKERYIFSALTIGVFTFTAFGAQAAESHAKNKEITELVGYNITEKTTPGNERQNAAFQKMDKDGNNLISLKEFQNASQLEDEYAVFIDMDKNKDKSVSFEELFSYDKTKGKTKIESELHGKVAVKGTNLTSRVYTEDNYYVPVDPVVVDVKSIEK